VAWWSILGLAVVVFYVLLTPIWIGLRLAAWAAELRARTRGGFEGSSSESTGHFRRTRG
jgi:hypothetical protein